jgi:hypothetical protein
VNPVGLAKHPNQQEHTYGDDGREEHWISTLNVEEKVPVPRPDSAHKITSLSAGMKGCLPG